MAGLFLAIYGIFFLLAGARGNAGTLVEYISEDIRPFAPWILSIVVIAILSEFEETKKLVKPFIALLILNFTLRNWGTIESEIKSIYGE